MAVDVLDALSDDDLACLLFGRYLRAFAAVEAELDTAIGHVLKLSGTGAKVVLANIDFQRKLSILHSAIIAVMSTAEGKEILPKDPDLKPLMSSLRGLGDTRNAFAHSRFEGSPQRTLVLSRIVAKGELKHQTEHWSVEDVAAEVTRLAAIASQMATYAAALVHYQPALDFSDSRNSMYLSLLIDD